MYPEELVEDLEGTSLTWSLAASVLLMNAIPRLETLLEELLLPDDEEGLSDDEEGLSDNETRLSGGSTEERN